MLNNDKLRILGIIKNKAIIGPKTLDILITSQCNLNCLFCTIHSPYNSEKIKKEHLPFTILKKVIDDAYKLKVENITLSGDGEPGLHPEICKIIDYIKKKKFFLNINTNLVFSKDILKCFLKADKLSINLSAYDEKTYSHIHRGNSFSFSQLINNLKIASEIYKKRGKPSIVIVYVVNSLNYKHILKFVKFIKNFHISHIDFNPLEVRPFIKRFALSKRKIINFCKLINKVKNEINFYNNLIEQEDLSISINKCYIPFFHSRIEVNGTVAFCCKNENLIIGNVYKDSFLNIWKSKRAEEIRKSAIFEFDLSKRKWKVCQSCEKYLKERNLLIQKEVEFLMNKYGKSFIEVNRNQKR